MRPRIKNNWIVRTKLARLDARYWLRSWGSSGRAADFALLRVMQTLHGYCCSLARVDGFDQDTPYRLSCLSLRFRLLEPIAAMTPITAQVEEIQLSAQYPRYGYRRIRIFLGRDWHRMSVGRAYRLWRAAGLQLPRKRPRKRVAAARPRPQAPSGPHQVWSYDFVFEHCANGQQRKCRTVTDEFTKEGLAIDVNARIRSPRVIDVLSRLVSARGAPSLLRSANGPEFVSKALLSWIVAQGIGTACSSQASLGRRCRGDFTAWRTRKPPNLREGLQPERWRARIL